MPLRWPIWINKRLYYMPNIYANLKKTEHPFNSIKWLEKNTCDGRLYDIRFLWHYPITFHPILTSQRMIIISKSL